MTEGRVAEIVSQGDRLGQLLVEAQDFRNRTGDLRHFERMRQACSIVIAGRREEHLRLVLQAAERLAMDDAVAVALKRGTDVVFRLRPEAAARVRAFGR